MDGDGEQRSERGRHADVDSPLTGLDITRIVTDGDLDGVMTAAILRRYWPDAEVVFGHPGALRAGLLDDVIDARTAVCDLPAHPAAGLLIDHHETNRPVSDPTADASGPVIIWRPTQSAARIAHDEVSGTVDCSDLSEAMEWVDRLDGGSITRQQYLSDHPMVRIARLVDGDAMPEVARAVLRGFERGDSPERLLQHPAIATADAERRAGRRLIHRIIDETAIIVERLAVVRFDGSGVRTNGYEITARIGDACDACILVHGWLDGSMGDAERPPVGASFYNNSFLHPDGGLADLTLLATAIDPDGGGHRDACGCRVKPLDDAGVVTERPLTVADLDANLDRWLTIWRSIRA